MCCALAAAIPPSPRSRITGPYDVLIELAGLAGETIVVAIETVGVVIDAAPVGLEVRLRIGRRGEVVAVVIDPVQAAELGVDDPTAAGRSARVATAAG